MKKQISRNDAITKIVSVLETHTLQNQPDYGDGSTLLEMIYESFCDHNNFETDQIKAGFEALYETMNGKTLQVCDKLIYPICALCRDHKKNGFIGGVKVGFLTTTGIIGRTVISGGREYVYCIK